jgi:NIMA (never in mitosis gene a)-related kinase
LILVLEKETKSYNYGAAKRSLYIVMEFADGGDLESYLKKQKSRYSKESTILHMFAQISLAIKHIHDRKILHRDLKSQNIFLTNDGNIKLGDFGLSRALGEESIYATTNVGTP